MYYLHLHISIPSSQLSFVSADCMKTLLLNQNILYCPCLQYEENVLLSRLTLSSLKPFHDVH